MATQLKKSKQTTALPQDDDLLLDLSNPDSFRQAFIASEILNRKY